VAAVGLSIPPDRPQLTGGAGPPFNIVPDLPAGVALDPATGTLAGVPLAISPRTAYTVTSSNAGHLAVTLLLTVGPAGSVRTQVLNFPFQLEQHSEWCAIACGTCILNYRGFACSQCAMVNYAQRVSNACDSSAPWIWWDVAGSGPSNDFGPYPSDTDDLEQFGVPCTGRYSALTFGQVKAEINADRPFIIHWIWSNGSDDHDMVGIGWDEQISQEVVIMDPNPNVGGIRKVSYAWLCYGTEPGRDIHFWDKTITLDH
jgi:hypothetical protein